jgi:anti-sigma factor RsiW
MRARGTKGPARPGTSNRALWERSRETEASPEETERFLDLAGFVDRRLDDDDRERVAALIARDATAAADVAAAQALTTAQMTSVSDAIIERAVGLVGVAAPRGEVVTFPPRHAELRSWRGAAGWSGLAAGIVLASWLGFNLGSNLPVVTTAGRSADDAVAVDLLDPAPLISRDAGDGSPI